MTTHLDNNGMTDDEVIEVAQDMSDMLIGIDEVMPVVTGLLRMGRLDLALPLYERVLPHLEDVTNFAYAHLDQWIAWTEKHPMREPHVDDDTGA